MSLKRLIVDTGERLADFCANDLQNQYYKYLFLSNAKKNIGSKPYQHDPDFEADAISYWKKHTGLKVNPGMPPHHPFQSQPQKKGKPNPKLSGKRRLLLSPESGILSSIRLLLLNKSKCWTISWPMSFRVSLESTAP